MLFSDELLQVGRAGNPKNHALMYAQAIRLHDLFNDKLDKLKGTFEWTQFKRLETTFDYVMKQLTKEGFDYSPFLTKNKKP